MKTILVLTDFSISADYTAHYALKFAQRIKANLLLCNIYKASAGELRPGHKERPLGINERNSIEDLGALMAELKTAVDAGEKTDFRPDIDQCSQEGLIKDTINYIASSHQAFMAIISMHRSRPLTSWFKPNHAWDIIEQANFPLLVIPYQVNFKNYKTIAFATDLNVTDTSVLNSLAGLAQYSDAGILIAHVTDNGSTIQEGEIFIKDFFNKGTLIENHTDIIYRAIKSSNVIRSLKQLAQDSAIDLLVLVKRPHNAFQRIFGRNVVRRLAKYPTKPLLVLPENNVTEARPEF